MIHNTCNMAIRDLPDMYALGPAALRLRAYISGKSPMAMLQLLHVDHNHTLQLVLLVVQVSIVYLHALFLFVCT